MPLRHLLPYYSLGLLRFPLTPRPDAFQRPRIAEVGIVALLEQRKEDQMSLRKGILSVGIALVFMLAGASPGAAAEFHAEGSPITLTGSAVEGDELTMNSGTVRCSETTYKGEQAGSTSSTIALTPTYTGCTGFGFSVTVHDNDCYWQYHSAPVTQQATADFVCPGFFNKSTTATSLAFGTTKCIVHIPEQTSVEHVSWHNEGSAQNRSLRLTKTQSFTYTQTAGTGFGACASGTFNNGSWTGYATIKGESGTTSVGIWLE
jgi:hypothetical protein